VCVLRCVCVCVCVWSAGQGFAGTVDYRYIPTDQALAVGPHPTKTGANNTVLLDHSMHATCRSHLQQEPEYVMLLPSVLLHHKHPQLCLVSLSNCMLKS
jgi:hypothetical protein